jgi:hypothetical protein
MHTLEKYKREAESMSGELSRKAARLQKRIAKLREGSGALTIKILHETQELASLARDIEIAIFVSIEARRKLAERGRA